MENKTKKELLALPHRKWDDGSGKFNEVILLPNGNLHDSGYQQVTIIGTHKSDSSAIICCACPDSIVWEGFGSGNASLRMDCLPSSGAFRFWCNSNNLHVTHDASSVTISRIV